MALLERLMSELRGALKSRNEERTLVLRYLLAQIHNKEIEKRAPLTDEETVAVFQREMKKRKESIELFKKGGRNDLAKKEEGELDIIEEYVPPELSREDIKKLVAELITQGKNDFSNLMKEAMARVKGRADGRMVKEIIEKSLDEKA